MAAVAYTTVINQTGGRKLFSFLPPHGVELDANQSFTYAGDITTRMIPGWPYHSDKDRPPNRSKVDSLNKAEAAKQLQVIRSPAPSRHDALTYAYRKSGRLFVLDPHFSR